MSKSLGQQLSALRRKGTQKACETGKFTSLMMTVGLGAGAIVKTDMTLLAMSFVCGLFAVMAFQAGPFPAYAARAIEAGRKVRQSADVSMEILFEQKRYYVTTPDREKREWRFEFIPKGWRPEPGKMTVEAYYLNGRSCPAALVTKQGIMIPRFKPRPVAQHALSYGKTLDASA